MAKNMTCLRDYLDPYTGQIHVRGQDFTHHDDANAEFHVQMGTLAYSTKAKAAKHPALPEPEPEPEPEEDVFNKPKHKGHK